ncbi:MAG: acyl-coenzyme A thioesterase PaaI-like protein [Desulforhopalus sp.]|jgi:acyl-coenzyme A thioesterase PaaI-like protein
MNSVLNIYQTCLKFPFGKWIFSKMISFKAPYFGSIKPVFVELQPGYSKIHLKKRRSVTNHLGTVHAIAMCNVSELAAGTMLEASIPEHMRWIPKGMTVSYQKLAKTDLIAECSASVAAMNVTGEFPMEIEVRDKAGEEVFHATIVMYLSEKKKKEAVM